MSPSGGEAANILAIVTATDPDAPPYRMVTATGPVANPRLDLATSLPPFDFRLRDAVAEAYGDQTGRVRASARTGYEAYEAEASVVWTETLQRDAGNPTYQFSITPGFLEIEHGTPVVGEGLVRPPYAEMSIEILRTGGAFYWSHVARIEGLGGDVNTETFELVQNSGELSVSATYVEDVFPIACCPDPVDSARYDTQAFTGSIDLSDVPVGGIETITYRLRVAVGGDGEETSVSAFIGDPMDSNSGISTIYSGLTAVPEPGVGLLLVAGLVSASRRKQTALR